MPRKRLNNTPRSLPDFLSVAEVARLLRVSRKTVYLSIGRNEIAGVCRIGGSIRVDRNALLASLQGATR